MMNSSATTLAGPADTVRIRGVLLEDARLLLRVDGTAEVHVRVRQEQAQRLSIAQAVQVFGSSHSAQYAAQRATWRLRKGRHATVHARRFDIVAGHLVLLDVSLIECEGSVDFTAPREVAA
jgi:hypothetical protein